MDPHVPGDRPVRLAVRPCAALLAGVTWRGRCVAHGIVSPRGHLTPPAGAEGRFTPCLAEVAVAPSARRVRLATRHVMRTASAGQIAGASWPRTRARIARFCGSAAPGCVV